MVPIFIITYDRLEVLKQSLESYHNYVKTPFEIVIIDFGSTYKPTVNFLKQLEGEGTIVYWKNKIIQNTELNKAGYCINDYFKIHPKSNYVVTDPDIALDNVEGDILDFYSFFLESMPQVGVVGTMLRMDDIPDYYPLKKELIGGRMGRRNRKFHSLKVNTIIYKGNNYDKLSCRIWRFSNCNVSKATL